MGKKGGGVVSEDFFLEIGNSVHYYIKDYKLF